MLDILQNPLRRYRQVALVLGEGVGHQNPVLRRVFPRDQSVSVIEARQPASSAAVHTADDVGPCDVIGVVAEGAASYALSYEAKKPLPTNAVDTFADGLAVRIPDARALEAILAGAARIVKVSELEMKAAVRHYYTDTHNLAEGAGAASLAALLQEKKAMAGRKVGLVLSGGNIDRDLYMDILGGS